MAALLLLLPLGVIAAEEGALPSEKDYLAEMPIVLSVSRLPQPLDETPGAVTVLDRDTIRRSGARDVTDLMRLVPGFEVSDSWEDGAPLAVYHGGFGSFSSRIQVLIDGRSVYSPYFLGTAANGLQTIALEDIDHIEVLRGSNSAAFGARAFLGVINIVTRAPIETRGVYVSKTGGENGVDDAVLRLGWGTDTANFRLSASRRGDDGLSGVNGHQHTETFNTGLEGPYGVNHVNLVNFRADLAPSARDEVDLRTGASQQYSGTGNPFSAGNPMREVRYGSAYLQADWKRILGQDADISASYSHTDERYTDHFPYALPPPFYGTVVDFGGNASNDALMVQHSSRSGAKVRIVWGGELRREEVRSLALYAQPLLATNFARLFGNLEWRIRPQLVLNAGASEERSSLSGSDLAPRLMLNWHVVPGQTLRLGVSKAQRPPSMFEQEANIRYVVLNTLIKETYVARGNVRPETLLAREIGYLGEMPALHLTADVRIFHEGIAGLILPQNYALPPGLTLIPQTSAIGFVNAQDFSDRGIEYQLKFKPRTGTQLLFGQTLMRIDSSDPATAMSAPTHAVSLALFQRLPDGFDFSLIHSASAAMTWERGGNILQPTARTDLRLAKRFRLGATRGELAAVVQNLGPPYNDFNNHFFFTRCLFTTLSLQL
ncbi:MAG TPA: TonB-dependent receptor [Rhodocyclaceae bacterium]|nr:TonB-dependent receptor [Rhodocyclaceae bacterium]